MFDRTGFADVEVEVAELAGRQMPAAELIVGDLSGTPVAEALDEMTTDARDAMVDTIMARMADHIDDKGQIRMRTRTHVVSATKT